MIDLFSVNGMKKPRLLITLIILIEILGILSGVLGKVNQNFYESLIKPSFAPPGWSFGVVWTIIYFLMAVSLYRMLLIGEQGENTGKSLILFFIQLILNFLWTLIFFRFKLYWIAFIELLVLIVFIYIMIIEFSRNDKLAGFIMIPYLLWVFYAGILNFYIAFMNS